MFAFTKDYGMEKVMIMTPPPRPAPDIHLKGVWIHAFFVYSLSNKVALLSMINGLVEHLFLSNYSYASNAKGSTQGFIVLLVCNLECYLRSRE